MSAIQDRRHQERVSTGVRSNRVGQRMHQGIAAEIYHWSQQFASVQALLHIPNGWNKYTHHRSCWPRHDFCKIMATTIGLEFVEISILCPHNQDPKIHVLEWQ